MGGDAERERWELRSGVGVGPLQFGMSPAEVAQALSVSGPQVQIGGPYAQEDFQDGVKRSTTWANWPALRWMRSPVRRSFCPASRWRAAIRSRASSFCWTTLRSMGTACSTRLMTRFPWLISGFFSVLSRLGQRV